MAERNAMAVGYRASMLPIGNHEDGSIAFPVWPQVAVDAYEALGRLGRGEPPQPQDAVLANLAVTGGIAMPRPAGSIGMAGRPRPMPEPGMLAEAGLTRMRAEDAVKPRPFPDAPQTMPELETYLQKNVDGNSRTRADEAWAADPTRYNAYSHGMADLLNPESQWWKGEPTLQSGGSMAPMAATGGTGMPGFEQAFAELDAALIDLDGDGVPDVQVPRNALASLTNRPPQSDASRVPYNPAAPDPNDDWWKGLQDPRFGPSPDRTPPEPPSVPMPQPGNMMAGNAMALPNYGFGPMTPMSRSGVMPQGELRSYSPTVGENAMAAMRGYGPLGERVGQTAGAVLDYGPLPAQGVVDQFGRAGTAVADAYNEPSLANVTNAGAQSALAVGRPVAAGAMLGAGMLEAARRDFAPDVFGSAEAQSLTNKQRRQLEMERQRAQGAAEADRMRMQAETEAQRQRAQDAASVAAEAERKRKEQEEYDRSVGFAESARNEELQRRHSFADTNLGAIYRETGGAAPFLLAAGLGGFARAGLGNNAMGKYIIPAAEGALTGTIGTGLPLVYDAYMTPAQNPEKAAYQAYARELPQSHPRKQEFADYAKGLPDENPVRPLARDELRSPGRLAVSALEGAGSGISGATVANAFARGGTAMGNAMAAPFRRSEPQVQTRVIYRGTDKLGRRYHVDESGRRVSAPSADD